ncbi:SagB/ThcOx family dehydrogenase [Candidatus Bipolaricaulota bacterium]
MEELDVNRRFLKADRWDEWAEQPTDQREGVAAPPVQKPCPQDASLVDLMPGNNPVIGATTLVAAIASRKSHRRFTEGFLTLEELSFLLWATQGVRSVSSDGSSTTRTVPSGGARHPLETYLVVGRVRNLLPGLYRYLPVEHKLCLLLKGDDLVEKAKNAAWKNDFVGEAAVVFVWTAIPYRAEWRYSVVAHKMIAIDSGHVCQNLYLACGAIGAGTCAVGAYSQDKMDAVLGVDGEEEFTIYVAPVGKVNLTP